MIACRCGGTRNDAGVCNRCGPRKSNHTKSREARGYDDTWQELSRRVRHERPLCEQCEKEGRITSSVEVHHVVPIRVAPALRLERANLMAVCKACHERLEAACS